MCGITGILHFDNTRDINLKLLEKMTNSLKHRGPDGEGYFIKNNIGLGHRRLSIIDLESGDQPIYNEEKNIAIVFNGEIYNYIELKNELKKSGHNFYTNSDTEVIIHAYEEWSYDCLNKFNGMWAFAIWDSRKNELFISRDRLGEKPFHYAFFDNSFIFGSEMKSILAYGLPEEPALELLEIYLTLGYVPAPSSFYKNIHKLKPGHYAVIKNNTFREYKYWDIPEIDEKNMFKDKEAIYSEFEYLLRDSIRLRMRSDVPFGAFLSGGLDSASVVSLMAEIGSDPVETFTAGFRNKTFDERELAREVAKMYNTNHNEKTIHPHSFEQSLSKILHYHDEPFGDSSAIACGMISEIAREKVKMAMSGDGGDEILSGYTAYQGEKFANLYMKMPQFMHKTAHLLISGLAKTMRNELRYKLNRIQNVLDSSVLDFNDRIISKAAWVDVSIIKNILRGNNVYNIDDFLTDFFNKCNYTDNFYRLMYFNFKLSLPDDMLVKVDIMSMANSLEVRIPFLDYRLVEFMVRVDKKIKMKGFQRKAILKNTIGNKLPASLLHAPKRGFNIPLREWFREDSLDRFINNLPRTAWSLNKNVISNIINTNRRGISDCGNFLWMLIILKEWLKK